MSNSDADRRTAALLRAEGRELERLTSLRADLLGTLTTIDRMLPLARVIVAERKASGCIWLKVEISVMLFSGSLL